MRVLANTGTAFFNVGRDGARGTAAVDGAFTWLEVEDFSQVGRDGGLGALNVTNGGAVDNFTAGSINETRIGANGTGTLNIESGRTYTTKTLAIGNGGDGTVNVANGGRLVADRTFNAARGTITGGGTIVGDITNAGGTIAAGSSPGLMNVLGNVDLLGGGTVEVELGGTVFDSGIPQFDYDRIDVSDDLATTGDTEGTVTIDSGALFDIDFFGVFTAGLGDTFDVIVADVIDVADLSSLIFDFTVAGLMSGLLWDIDIVSFGQGREALQLSVVSSVEVSEPTAMLILIGGVGVLAAIRRRRRVG